MAPTATGPATGPIRSCRVCRRRLPKANLIRWVWQGGWVQDATQVLAGRGAYTCSSSCVAKLAKLRPRPSASNNRRKRKP